LTIAVCNHCNNCNGFRCFVPYVFTKEKTPETIVVIAVIAETSEQQEMKNENSPPPRLPDGPHPGIEPNLTPGAARLLVQLAQVPPDDDNLVEALTALRAEVAQMRTAEGSAEYLRTMAALNAAVMRDIMGRLADRGQARWVVAHAVAIERLQSAASRMIALAGWMESADAATATPTPTLRPHALDWSGENET
jgi:hypothetical protein